MTPVAHHQPPPVLVELVGVLADVGGDLGLQRRREHPARALTHDLVQHRPARLEGGWRVPLLTGYREHRRTFPTRVSARASLDLTFRRHSGRYALPDLIHRFQALLCRCCKLLLQRAAPGSLVRVGAPLKVGRSAVRPRPWPPPEAAGEKSPDLRLLTSSVRDRTGANRPRVTGRAPEWPRDMARVVARRIGSTA